MTASDNRQSHTTTPAYINPKYTAKKRGKLKIFFGMCAGVGKTYSMLQTAHQDLARGADVVVGSMEPNNHRDTDALLAGLETVPRRKAWLDGSGPEEMDLDAIITRRPYLVIVDELAHTNAEGCRHTKRYHDVKELLDNGINVYTTLNIQNLESRCDSVSRITGLTITDTVPDEMFEITDDVELIDIASTALLDRLAQGKVYDLAREGESERRFFTKSNIIALREMALRLVADRVDKQFKSFISNKQVEGPLASGLKLLVLVGVNESSAKLLRWAKTFSYSMGADIMALHVQTGNALSESQSQQLAKNLSLAREFGAEVMITSGGDIVDTALEIARKENITHIITGKPAVMRHRRNLFLGVNYINRLLKGCGEIDVYVINPKLDKPQQKKRPVDYSVKMSASWKDYVISFAAIVATVLISLPLQSMIGYQPISFILLFVVLLLAMFFSLGPVLLAAGSGALAWTLFFVQPIYTIRTSRPEDTLAIITFFVIALVIGSIASKMRKEAKLRRKSEEKTNALFHLTNRLASANGFEEITKAAKEEIYKYFGVETYFLLQDGLSNLPREQADSPAEGFTDAEFHTAQWTFKYSSKAGRHTDTLSSSSYTFFPLVATNTKPGVVVAKSKKRLDSDSQIFWYAIIKQVSNAFEHHYYGMRTKKANLLYESDKLYRSLFNSVSHEFRIPLAAIMGAADTLMANQYPEEIKQDLYSQIFTASNRLNRLVDNLLNISRLENRKVAPNIDWVDIQDLFNQVVSDLEEDLKPFKITLEISSEMPLVKLDFGLIAQALYNLVDNSCKYAKPDSTITLKAFYDSGYLIIQEADRGPGFAPGAQEVLFNKFYRADQNTSGGLGLGLSIVQGFVEAHGGTISADNRAGGGAVFTIKIPTQISYTDNTLT